MMLWMILMLVWLVTPAWSAPAAQYTVVPLEHIVIALDTDDQTAVGIELLNGNTVGVVVRANQPAVPLPLLPDGVSLTPLAIRDTIVVGTGSTGPFGLYSHAFRGTPDGLVDLGTLGGPALFSAAECRTPEGLIGGGGDQPDTPEGSVPLLLPVVWTQDTPQALPTLGDGGGLILSCATAGFAGYSKTVSGATHAAFWPADTLTPQDLQTLEGVLSVARSINASGTIVGNVTQAAVGSLPFRWTQASGMTVLALPPDTTQGRANSINDAGASVGRTFAPGGGPNSFLAEVATLWGDDGTPVNLQTRVAATDYTLKDALAIGPQGTILVRAQKDGRDQYALLVPVAEEQEKGKKGEKPKDEKPKRGRR